MIDGEATAEPTGAFGLLESAIGYALGAVQAVTPQLLHGPTPCAEWDLGTLLHHLNDALEVLADGSETRRINAYPSHDACLDGRGDPATDPAAIFNERASRLRGAWRVAGDRQVITVDGHPLTASAVAAIGAIEIVVHGWDVSQACGQARPVPEALAIGLLAICPLVVTNATRHRLFADPVPTSLAASPSDLLIAFLGRTSPP